MSDQGNIFLTYENLAFSMPLIVVVGSYLVFTYVPFHVTAIVAVAIFVLYQIRQQLAAQREKKLQNLDEDAIRDMIGLEDDEADGKKKKEQAKTASARQKARNKVQQRLASEKKAEAKKKGGGGDGDEGDGDDDDNLAMFAKGSRGAGGKKKQ